MTTTSTPAVRAEGVWKRFRRGERHDSLRDLIPALLRRGRRDDTASNEFWAVQDVNFDVDFGLPGTGLLYDQADCSRELLPLDPDVATGVDNTDPTVTIDAPDLSEGVTVPVSITNVTDVMDIVDGAYPEDPLLNFSGVVAVECGTNGVDYTACGQGIHPVTFGGDGSQTVYVRVTDVAGNQTVATDTVVVDGQAPSSTAVR